LVCGTNQTHLAQQEHFADFAVGLALEVKPTAQARLRAAVDAVDGGWLMVDGGWLTVDGGDASVDA
jgi:hypothetical protein